MRLRSYHRPDAIGRGVSSIGPPEFPSVDGPRVGWRPVVALLVAAPACAELVTGSTPPLLWILPPVFFVFVGVYGLGALGLRELSVRWNIGWPGRAVLGIAFGVLNEGFAAQTLFSPQATNLGIPLWYGRWDGIPWVWTVWIVGFHAIMSISFPIFLVEWRWPELRNRSWISGRATVAALAGAVGVAVLVDFVFSTYRLSAAQWLGGSLAIVALVAAARWAAVPLWNRVPVLAPFGRWWHYSLAMIGFLGVSYLAYAGGPGVGGVPLGNLLELLGADVGLILVVKSTGGPEGERRRFAILLGAYTFFLALSPISEFAFGYVGLVPVDVAWMGLLVYLYRRHGPRVEPPVPRGAAGTANG
jgi:hypothetical protein